jgi:hypothetical protein
MQPNARTCSRQRLKYTHTQQQNNKGDDVVIETAADRVLFRTLNSAQSAYTHFSFLSLFFSTYRHTEAGRFIKCKVNLKSCLAAFRQLQGVVKFVFALDAEDNKLVFTLTNRTGIKRTYR